MRSHSYRYGLVLFSVMFQSSMADSQDPTNPKFEGLTALGGRLSIIESYKLWSGVGANVTRITAIKITYPEIKASVQGVLLTQFANKGQVEKNIPLDEAEVKSALSAIEFIQANSKQLTDAAKTDTIVSYTGRTGLEIKLFIDAIDKKAKFVYFVSGIPVDDISIDEFKRELEGAVKKLKEIK